MRSTYLLFFLLISYVISFTTCEAPDTDAGPAETTVVAPPTLPAELPATPPQIVERPLAPDELFGELFRRVQMERVFDDGKTFVDMIPKQSAREIMDRYEAAKQTDSFNLKSFVERHFDPPASPDSDFTSDGSRSITEHIDALWPVLTRSAGADEGSAGSLIVLPKPYVVPGGRFREIYYWDSYFTLLGLQAANRRELVRDMVENFAFLIDTIGHIPNGNRTYYLTRSQPPFYVFMVEVLAEMEGDSVYAEFLPQLEREYAYWMKGAERLSEVRSAADHVVRMPDGSLLNRYYDAGDRPRAESYREDVMTIRESGRDSQLVARHLRSGAESGWDFSARWFADGRNIATIVTTDIIPPDLNSLLYKLERTLATVHTDEEQRRLYGERANERAAAMDKYLWNEGLGWYEDYNWKDSTLTGYLTLAGVYPLFVGLTTPDKAARSAEVIQDKFLAAGGVRTSLVDTDQQWDAPNGWPPLQWMTYAGLLRYDMNELAGAIRRRWMRNNERVYENVDKMVEKYNVEDITLLAGGGEYPVQDGFGWSNGVYLKMATASSE